jgi:tetratricopeptide (TPR) repeat protein
MTPGLLGGLFSRGPSEQTITELESALEEHIDPDEQVQFRLPGKGPLVHETGGESEESGAGGSLAVVTGDQVLFVTMDDEVTAVDVPHTDISGASVDSGLLKTVLTVEHRAAGSYRFRPGGSEAQAAAEYIEQASDCWQFVETLLEELESHAERIQTAIEEGEFDRLTALLEKAEETTDELDERVSSAGLENALGDRVEAARRNLQQTRVRTRQELARSQVAEAGSRHLHGVREIDYAGAFECYASAHEHLSAARSIAEEHDLDASAVLDSLEQVHQRVDVLTRQPVGLAKQATERALGTNDDAVRIESMRAALDHYHDALTVGWGLGVDRPYDRDELRFRVALLADGLVDARREYATELEATGDALAEEGNDEAARERYRAAVDQLAAAVDLAHEFYVPDPDPVERERSRVERRLDEHTDRTT